MWHGTMGWWGNGWGGDWGGGLLFGLAHLLWWVALIGAIALILRWLGPGGRRRGAENRALSILKERYARGEIDKQEFDAKRRDLE